MNEIGITNLGQVFIPEEYWGPFSTPVDLVYEEGVKKAVEDHNKEVNKWRKIVFFLVASFIGLGIFLFFRNHRIHSSF